jgi:hypothetical protein
MKWKREEKQLTQQDWLKEDYRLLTEVAAWRAKFIAQQDWAEVFILAQTIWNHGASSDDTVLGVKVKELVSNGVWPLLYRNGMVEVGIYQDDLTRNRRAEPLDHHGATASVEAMASIPQDIMVAKHVEQELRTLDDRLVWLRDRERRLAEKPPA